MRTHAPSDYRCPFCAIVRGVEGPDVATKQDDVVLRTAAITAFVSSHQWPNNPGHVLVIPNRHIENLYSLPEELALPLQRAVRSVALALLQAYDYPGTSTRQHNEPAGGQDVWHYHMHVFPRYAADKLYRSDRSRVAAEDRSVQARAIRHALDQTDKAGKW